MTAFAAAQLETIGSARTVRIRTSPGPGRQLHEATIWIVVDDVGRVLVRSVRGPQGRWYRELRVHPAGVLLMDGAAIPVSAELATDEARIDACSSALRRKYAGARGSLASMLAPETLDATLELRPARGE
jgi:hypothetical protein